MSRILNTHCGLSQQTVASGDGCYVVTGSGDRLLDLTAGSTSCVVLGYNHPAVLAAMRAQMDKACYIDYKAWSDPGREVLAGHLLTSAPAGLESVYLCGSSGSEAIEAAMKLSYQVHYDTGKPSKRWFISHTQSYHGATTDTLSLGDRPNYAFYGPILPKHRTKIEHHHPLAHRGQNESEADYAVRSAKHLEEEIIELGPDNVCAYIGETMLGGLIGDVPPAPGYWKHIREICDRYSVHLILDEVYCGLGCSGKVYCCSWDGITPDFLCVSKTLTAGYVPLSAVLTTAEVRDTIARVQGRVQHGHTNQGHALAVAAAIAVQEQIQSPEMLSHIQAMGSLIQTRLNETLGEHPFFRNTRGRGLRVSMEYACARQHEFGLHLSERMLMDHKIIISGKWHRVSFTPPFIISKPMMHDVLDKFVDIFVHSARTWETQ